MSSPFGHSIAGYIVAAYESKTLKVLSVRKLVLYIFMANAPDLDFIPGLLMGRPNLFHHGVSHSLGAAVLFSIVAAFFMSRKESNHAKNFLICFSLFSFHLLLDYISADGRPPFGIPLFWPLSNEYSIFPLLPPIAHSSLDYAIIRQFLGDLFSIHNLYVILLELAITVPVLLLLKIFNSYRIKLLASRLKAE